MLEAGEFEYKTSNVRITTFNYLSYKFISAVEYEDQSKYDMIIYGAVSLSLYWTWTSIFSGF